MSPITENSILNTPKVTVEPASAGVVIPVTLFSFVRQVSPENSDSSALTIHGEASRFTCSSPEDRPHFFGPSPARQSSSELRPHVSCSTPSRGSFAGAAAAFTKNPTPQSDHQLPNPKSTPASRGAHIHSLKVVSRCKPRCRHRHTVRGR